MFKIKNSFFLIFIVGLIGGCGGGTSNQGSASDSSIVTFIPGVYKTLNNCIFMTHGTLIDDDNNMYQVCGTKLSVGKLSGTRSSSETGYGSVKFTVFDSGTPASTLTLQLPSGPVTVPVPAGNPTVSISDTFSGTLLTNNSYVVEINFSDTLSQPRTNTFDSKWVGPSPVGSIMESYSTLSGNYISYLPEKLAVDRTENIIISTDGVVSGTTNLGLVMGKISKFNSTTGVHDVNITLTPLVGLPIVMTGVIGPFDVNMTGAVQNVNYAGLFLALSGNGIGFYKIFKHL